MKILLHVVSVGLILSYPLLVFFGLSWLEPRYFAFIIVMVVVLRHLLAGANGSASRLSPVTSIVSLAVAFALFASNSAMVARLYPVLVSWSLFLVFSATLFRPPSFIQQIAELQHGKLDEAGISYTRKVTVLWCAFFIVNGAIALVLGMMASLAWWTLYTGLVSYLAMGLLFFGEWLYRTRFR